MNPIEWDISGDKNTNCILTFFLFEFDRDMRAEWWDQGTGDQCQIVRSDAHKMTPVLAFYWPLRDNVQEWELGI